MDGLRISMLKLLEELAFEREQHRRRANACKDKIKALRDEVALSKTQSYISDLERLGYKIDEIEAFVLQHKKKQSKAGGTLEDLMREEREKSGKNDIEL